MGSKFFTVCGNIRVHVYIGSYTGEMHVSAWSPETDYETIELMGWKPFTPELYKTVLDVIIRNGGVLS